MGRTGNGPRSPGLRRYIITNRCIDNLPPDARPATLGEWVPHPSTTTVPVRLIPPTDREAESRVAQRSWRLPPPADATPSTVDGCCPPPGPSTIALPPTPGPHRCHRAVARRIGHRDARRRGRRRRRRVRETAAVPAAGGRQQTGGCEQPAGEVPERYADNHLHPASRLLLGLGPFARWEARWQRHPQRTGPAAVVFTSVTSVPKSSAVRGRPLGPSWRRGTTKSITPSPVTSAGTA